MGGKNCVIVDSDADLDDVVPALVKSAFNYAGQKCSAAARVLAHEAIHDGLVERLAGAIEVLHVGQASDPEIDVPPVIEREAQERVARYAATAQAQGRIAGRAARGAVSRGWFAAPTLAADLPADSPVLQEEIFGPLLAIERVRSIEEACDRVDASPFGLTGGLFSRSPQTVDYVTDRLAGREPVRQPRDHGRDGRPPAVRRQPPVRHRHQGRRARLPAAVRRAARGDREHRPARVWSYEGRPRGRVDADARRPLDRPGGVHRALPRVARRRLPRAGDLRHDRRGELAVGGERIEAWELLVADGIPAETLLPGTGACALPDAVELSRSALALGAAGVLALPPFYYKGVSDEACSGSSRS